MMLYLEAIRNNITTPPAVRAFGRRKTQFTKLALHY